MVVGELIEKLTQLGDLGAEHGDRLGSRGGVRLLGKGFGGDRAVAPGGAERSYAAAKSAPRSGGISGFGESAADSCGGQPSRWRGFLPRPAKVLGQRAGEAQLGVRGDHQPRLHPAVVQRVIHRPVSAPMLGHQGQIDQRPHRPVGAQQRIGQLEQRIGSPRQRRVELVAEPAQLPERHCPSLIVHTPTAALR